MGQHELFQLVHRDVAVGVRLNLLSELLLEGLLILSKLDLQLAVHFDEALLDVLNNILRHLLLVEHNIVVIVEARGVMVRRQLGRRTKRPLRGVALGSG